MKTRILAAASVSAMAVGTLVAPVAFAQEVSPSSSATPTKAPAAGSLGSAGLGESGSLGGSAQGLTPTSSDKACKLPNLGGSVAKIFPLLGITGVPSVLINLATGTLDSFPNALTVLGLDGQISQLGSLEGPLCSTVFGGTLTGKTTPTSPTTPVSASTPSMSTPAKPNGSLGGLNLGS